MDPPQPLCSILQNKQVGRCSLHSPRPCHVPPATTRHPTPPLSQAAAPPARSPLVGAARRPVRVQCMGRCAALAVRATAAPLPERFDTLSQSAQQWVMEKAAAPKGDPSAVDPQRGKRPPPTAEVSAAAAALAAACGADPAATARALACLGPGMQQGVINHGLEVARFLASLGVGAPLVAGVLRRCLPLFSQPPEKRCAPLTHQLMDLGLSAEQAACCFERVPAAAVSPGFGPAIQAAAELLESGHVTDMPGRRLVRAGQGGVRGGTGQGGVGPGRGQDKRVWCLPVALQRVQP